MTNSLLRKIEPVTLPNGDIPNPSVGKPPEIMWVVPTELYVDDKYQRGLNDQSWRAIRRISREWDWDSYKIPNVNLREDGKMVIVDGQHTVYGAASNPNVTKIPIMVRHNMSAERQAESFVSLNTKRIGVSAYHIFKAELAAGKQIACELDKVMKEVGVELKINVSALKGKSTDKLRGFTSAIAAIKRSYAVLGLIKTKYLLKCLYDCNIGVISSRQIEGLISATLVSGKKPVDYDRVAIRVSEMGLLKMEDAIREIIRERKCSPADAYRLFFTMLVMDTAPIIGTKDTAPKLLGSAQPVNKIERMKELNGTNTKQFNEPPKPKLKPVVEREEVVINRLKIVEQDVTKRPPVTSSPPTKAIVGENKPDKPTATEMVLRNQTPVRKHIPRPMTRKESIEVFAKVAERMAQEEGKKPR